MFDAKRKTEESYYLDHDVESIRIKTSAFNIKIMPGNSNQIKIIKDDSFRVKAKFEHGNLFIMDHHQLNFKSFKPTLFDVNNNLIVITLKNNEIQQLQLNNSAGNTKLLSLKIDSGRIMSNAGDIKITDSVIQNTVLRLNAGNIKINSSILGENNYIKNSAGNNIFTDVKFIYGYSLSISLEINRVLSSDPNDYDEDLGTTIINGVGNNLIK